MALGQALPTQAASCRTQAAGLPFCSRLLLRHPCLALATPSAALAQNTTNCPPASTPPDLAAIPCRTLSPPDPSAPAQGLAWTGR